MESAIWTTVHSESARVMICKIPYNIERVKSINTRLSKHQTHW